MHLTTLRVCSHVADLGARFAADFCTLTSMGKQKLAADLFSDFTQISIGKNLQPNPQQIRNCGSAPCERTLKLDYSSM